MAVDIIDRSKLSGLIPEPVTREIIQGAVAESAVLRMARRLPNMTSKTQTLNVLDALPTAYFVNGEATSGAADSKASLKKTTNMAWDKKKIYAEEIAAKYSRQKHELEEKVRLLSSDSLDLDMLDERARAVLNLARKDEFIILDSEEN